MQHSVSPYTIDCDVTIRHPTVPKRSSSLALALPSQMDVVVVVVVDDDTAGDAWNTGAVS